MVVPMNANELPVVNSAEIVKFVGNNLQLNFPQNRSTILAIGNNSSLKIARNFGLVKVIGNNCVIEITECRGAVEYIGNNGRISLEGDAGPNAVSYVGFNGNLSYKKKKNPKGAEKTNSAPPKNIVRTQTVFIENNVSIPNAYVKVGFSGFNSFLPVGVFTS